MLKLLCKDTVFLHSRIPNAYAVRRHLGYFCTQITLLVHSSWAHERRQCLVVQLGVVVGVIDMAEEFEDEELLKELHIVEAIVLNDAGRGEDVA